MDHPSRSHLILIPSYNTGGRVLQTVWDARQIWQPVWVVVDGSTDGTLEALQALARDDPQVRVLSLPRNQGKGAAILHGLRAAAAAGFTHAMTMDADGQHPTDKIREFMAASASHPGALILGRPVFDASAPRVRVHGRKLSNWCTGLETLGAGIGDSLYGFRVYPIAPLREIMERQPWMRRFDFDAEAAVRLVWRGVRPINLAAPVRYFRPEEGGVSHFCYLRDNALLTWMHTRLILEGLVRLPVLLGRRLADR
ncbi:MAG TPA: glycosyltransferase family 2 protein [Burkholderiales bacterium]|jgi:glycosyltransferase involved in cell wall biosynthesis